MTEARLTSEPITSARALRWRSQHALGTTAPWIIAAIATTGLYFGRSILLPIILAVLLSFLLAPIVSGFRRLRVPRVPAVLCAVALALGGIGVTSAVIVSQAATLSKDAPAYAERITAKAGALRVAVHERFGAILPSDGGSSHRKARSARAARLQVMNQPTSSGAVPVEIRAPPASALDEVRSYVVPALESIETILIVLIVTIFILFQKKDLRDRLIRLMGTADLHRTAVALDEGAKRLSKYFLSQSVVNLGFGLVVWGGLFLIGVPSPGLWGALAGFARFVPYVGVVVGMAGPLALAAAVDPGWLMVFYVVLLFVVIEPIVGYVIEPLLYGHSTGLSPVSVVIAALFWTWIWGPVGLVLAMPVTLMLVVLGRHIPAFEIFDVLLGDRPALSPAETFYQRVLAGNVEEAIEQGEACLETMSIAQYFDDVVLGGMRLAAADFDRGAVDRHALISARDAILEVLEALQDYRYFAVSDADLGPTQSTSQNETGACETPINRSVLCLAGRGPLDPAVARMTAQMLRRAGCSVEEQVRLPGRLDDPSKLAVGDAEFVCMLGLFDERGYRRMERLAKSLRAKAFGITVLIALARTQYPVTKPAAEGLILSLNQLCQEVCGAEQAEQAAPDIRFDVTEKPGLATSRVDR
ncbi:AI-2E family transporter [Sphingomonas sp. AAP5]|uniref:AI-2E family transporter n=1 Tax=Sphingomonas sp. AAP5 TaxID=1523415 RepID=UPI0010571200|nr:AI-2E family transporter [Sphingomonas sp. AAP5]QBM76630.1 AI-2E family transporter [Sphingomonas sp. AAP5]